MHGIEVVDWGAVLGDIEIFGARLGKLHDALADGGMEKADTDCGGVSFTTRLWRGKSVVYHLTLETQVTWVTELTN